MSTLSAERWRAIEPIFEAALDLAPEERASYLDTACAGDRRLRQEVAALLEAADDEAGSLLDRDLPAFAATVLSKLRQSSYGTSRVGTRIGSYRVLESLGRGGMGEVLLAERADGQFEARVAIKLLSAGRTSPELERRFLLERQILARLEHPNIAHLLDGGVTEDGVPYLVMEYVAGLPITDFCRAERLDVDARLELFLAVCAAVEHAHARLIVHRDLKPGNILVTDDGEVKLLDFGIAKLLGEGAGGEGEQTVLRAMTPLYASPEQVLGRPISTASDVWSLGVILYELLAGRPPTIEELDPTSEDARLPPPSRRAEERSVAKRLRGDLDRIVARSLSRPLAERYPSVEALRSDLERHRAGLPVRAHGDAWTYRARKFIRRHRFSLAATALAIAGLIGGLLAATWQARIAAEERDRARSAQATTSAINRFLVDDLLGAADPADARGRVLTMPEVLEAASRRVENAFRDRPEIEAEVRAAIGETYLRLGDPDAAAPHIERSLALWERVRGPDAPATLSARTRLADLLRARGELAAARRLLTATLEQQRQSLGPDALDTLRTRSDLGRLLHELGDWPAADRLLRSTADRLEASHPEAVRELCEAEIRRTALLWDQRRVIEAEALSRRVLERQRRVLGANHPDVVETLRLRALVLERLERLDEAATAQREGLELSREILGPDHPGTLEAMYTLGRIYIRGRHYDEAEAILREALEIARRTLGDEHPQTIGIWQRLGITLRYAGRLEEAEAIYRQTLGLYERTLGEEHPATIRSMKNLSILLDILGRETERRRLVQRILRIGRRTAVAEDDPTRLSDFAEYLLVCEPEDLRDPRLAYELAERAVALSESRLPDALITLAMAHRARGEPVLAVAALREAAALPDALHLYAIDRLMLELGRETGDREGTEAFLLEHLGRRRAARSEDDPLIGYSLHMLGRFYLAESRYEGAVDSFRQAEAQYRKRYPPEHPLVQRSRAALGAALLRLGAPERAEPLLVEAYDRLRGDIEVGSSAKREVLGWIVELYTTWGRPEEAARWQRELEAHRRTPELGNW